MTTLAATPAPEAVQATGARSGTSFVGLTLVEIRRALHRPLVRWMIVLALLMAAFGAVIIFLTSNDPVELANDPSHPANMVAWHRPGEDGALNTFALFLVVGAAICGASVAGAEWKAGTITTVLTWEPRRLRLHLARTLSAGVLAFTIGYLLLIACLAAIMPAVIAHGSTAGTDAEWWATLALALARVALVAAMVAVLAVSIATIGRNTSAALVVMAAWAIVVERIVVALRPGWARFMISENVATFVPWRAMENVSFQRGPLVALVALLAYLGIVVALATASFVRRDIAATA